MTHSSDGTFETASLSGIHWLAIVLALITGVLHVYAGVVEGRIPLLLAGVGFFGAVVLVLMNFRRQLLYLVGILYTFIQVPIWYVVKAGDYTTLGYVDKAVQVALILVLLSLYVGSRGADTGTADSPTA